MPETAEDKTTARITVLATGDLHGRLFPYDYIANREDRSGSVAQLSTALQELYDPLGCLLLDAGDTIQDNFGELFLHDAIHPMMSALNDMHYDVWTTGNHEYEFGMDVLLNTMHSFKGNVLLANVYEEDGMRLAKPWAICERKGVRIAIVSMVTPLVGIWSGGVLGKRTVTDPVEETKRVLKEIEGKYDILLGLHHMGIEDEQKVYASGVRNYLKHFPEYDAVIASHEHVQAMEEINGVLVLENLAFAESMAKIDFELEKTEEGWKIRRREGKHILIREYHPDEAMMRKYSDVHARIQKETARVIGVLEGVDALARENEIDKIPTAVTEPTALLTLLNNVMRYYSGAPVSSAMLARKSINLYPGEISLADAQALYPYYNTLAKVRMTGRQLKLYMEWSAAFFGTYQEGDLSITLPKGENTYGYDMFSGVNYEIDVSKEPGERIVNLTWPDGTPVKETDTFEAAVTGYRYDVLMSHFGPICQEEDGLPELIDKNMHSELNGIQGMIVDYIEHVLHGRLVPETEDNWRIVGNNWDNELHQRAVELWKQTLQAELLEEGARALREEMLKELEDSEK